MKELKIKTNPKVVDLLRSYPVSARKKLEGLRQLILETAGELEDINAIEETLKWSEPSYVTKTGSTLRIDWKEKTPGQYAMYFNCNSRLVTTFKMLYADTFQFEGNRAIIFQIDRKVPKAELKNCITAALRYHKVKHLPTLGI